MYATQDATSAQLTKREEGPIHSALSRLGNAQAQTCDLLEQLSSRLQQVLRPTPPTGESTGRPTEAPQSQLHESILSACERETSRHEVLQSLLQRLTL